MANVFGFGADDVSRIARSVRRLETTPESESWKGDSVGYVGGAQHFQWLQVTSTTPTDGRYPARRYTYDPEAKTWTEVTEDLWLVVPNTETVGTGIRYQGLLHGYANGRYVYVAEIPSSGGSGTVTSVGLSFPGAAFITISGSPVTGSGTLTGTWTGTTGDLLYASSTNTWSLRAIGTSGQVLTVSGGVPVWADPAGGTTHTLLNASTHTDTDNQAPSVGSLIIGIAGPLWGELVIGANHRVLFSNGTTASWAQIDLSTAVVTGTLPEVRGGTNQSTYTQGDILYSSALNTLSKLAIGTSGFVLTVVGGMPAWAAPVTAHALLSATHTDTVANAVSRGSLIYGNATPAWDELVIGAANRVLFSNGTDVSWSQVDLSTTVVTGVLPEARGGTNQSTYTTGDLLYASGSNTLAKRLIGTTGHVLTVVGGVPEWAAPASVGSHNLLSATHGDTVANAVTRGSLIYGNATPAWDELAIGAAARILQSDGTDVAWIAVSSDIMIAVGGAVTIQPNVVTDTKLRDSVARSVIGRSSNSPGDPADIQSSLDGQLLRQASGSLSFGSIDLDNANAVSGTLGEIYGGTNQSTYATGDILYSSGANTLAKLPIGSSGFLLTVSSGVPAWVAPTMPAHALLSATHSDTVVNAVSRGSLIYGNATPAWDELLIGAASRILQSDGTDVSWVAVSGDITLDAMAVATIGNDKVTNAKLRDSVARSVIGRSSNSPGDPADIQSGLDGQVLRQESGSLTFGALDLDSANSVAGTLGEVFGGTNQSSYTTGDVLYASASNTLSKRPIGTTGHVLTVVGGVPDWAAPASIASHNLLSATHGDTVANAVTRGSLIYGNATPAWDELTIGATGRILQSDGSDVAWVAVSGDVAIVAGGDVTIKPNVVTDTKLRDSSALSVIGRASNSSGDPADIAAGTDGHVLRRSGVTLGFGAIDLDNANSVTGTLGETNGGTNQSSYTAGDLLYASGLNMLGKLPIGSPAHVLTVSGGLPVWAAPATQTHALLSATHTDTVANTVSRGSLIYGNATPAWDELTIGASGRILQSNGTDVSWVAVSDDVTIAAGGAVTISNSAVTDAKLRDSVSLSVIGRFTNTPGPPADIQAAADHRVLRRSGTEIGFGSINLASANAVTSVLAEANGGTNQSTYTVGDLLYCDVTNTLTKLAIGSSGQLLQVSSGKPSWQSIALGMHPLLSSTTHTDTVTQTVSRGSLIYGNATPAWDELPIGVANRFVRSDGTDVAWSQVNLGTADVTGTLTVPNGGTGNTTFTAGQILYGNGTSAVATSANLFFDGSNLGVGTSSPQTTLHVSGAAIRMERSGNTPSLELRRSGGLSFADFIGAVDYVGLSTTMASLLAVYNGSGADAIWYLYTGSTLAERLRVAGDGMVTVQGKIQNLTQGTATNHALACGRALISSNGTISGVGNFTNDLDLAVVPDATIQKVCVRRNSVLVGARRQINFIEDGNITITATEDVADNEIEIRFSATGATNHAMLSATHTDSEAASVVRGDLITGQGVSTLWKRLALGAGGRFMQSDGTDAVWLPISGDATVASGGILTIANDAVTYAKMQNVVNNNRFLGRISGAGGDTEELTGTQATTLLDTFTSSLKGLAPASGGGTDNYLRADGLWRSPPGNALTDGDKGDITVSSSGTVWTIDNDVVTFAKMQNISTQRLLGRSTSGAGDIEEISIDASLTLTAGTLSLTQPVTLGNGGTGAILSDPNADRILFWDDSAGQVTWLEAGTGLTISGTTITASGGGLTGSGTTGKLARWTSSTSLGDSLIQQSGSDLTATSEYFLFAPSSTGSFPVVQIYSNSAGRTGPLLAVGGGGGSAYGGDILSCVATSGTTYTRVNKNGYFGTQVTSAPADGDVATSEIMFWFDDNTSSPKLKLKGKASNGTVFTGEVTLV